MNLLQIKQRLTELKPELHEKFSVSEIGVFGSFVRGDEKRTSDVDVLVDFDRLVTLFTITELQFFLEKKLRRKVDIALKDGLKEYIGRQILSEVQYL